MLESALDFPNWLSPIVPFPPPIGPFEIGGMTIGPFVLRWYALAYIAGLLLGWRYMVRNVRNPALWGAKPAPATPLQIDDFLFYATLGVILGGRLGYVLFYQLLAGEEARDALLAEPAQVLRVWEGGMSFHGGLIGVGIALYLFARSNKVPLLSIGDLAAAATPIGLFFGRLANFVNAELYGRPTDLPWGIRFPTPEGGMAIPTEPRHPSQLYEAALEGLVLFAILRFATHHRGAFQRPGLTMGLFLAGYGAFRFLVEFAREPDAQMPEFLREYVTMGMLLCVPMIAGGAWLAWRALRGPTTPSPAASTTPA